MEKKEIPRPPADIPQPTKEPEISPAHPPDIVPEPEEPTVVIPEEEPFLDPPPEIPPPPGEGP